MNIEITVKLSKLYMIRYTTHLNTTLFCCFIFQYKNDKDVKGKVKIVGIKDVDCDRFFEILVLYSATQ